MGRTRQANARTESTSGPVPLVRTPGRPLDTRTRALFEGRFGHDFSNVRVHADADAARSIGASAFTTGEHIVFGGRASQARLAHELAHVVQQRRGSVLAGMSEPHGSDERSADRAAAAVMRGERTTVDGGDAHAVQRNVLPTEKQLDPESEPVLPPMEEVIATLAGARAALDEGRFDPDSAIVVAQELQQAEDAVAQLEGRNRASAGMVMGTVATAGRFAPHPLAKAALLGLVFLVAALQTSARNGAALRQLGRSLERLGALPKPRPVAPAPAAPETAKFPPAPAPRPAPAPSPSPKTQSGPRVDPVAPPLSRPDPDVDDDHRRGCRGYAAAQRGGHTCHDDYAFKISGTPRDYDVRTPEGRIASYDGRALSPTLYEVKTGYRFLLGPDSDRKRSTLAHLHKQAANQKEVADRCGYDLIWFFNEKAVADAMRGQIEPRVMHVPFKCKKPLPPEAEGE